MPPPSPASHPVPTTLGEVPAAVEAELSTFFDTAVAAAEAVSPVVGDAATILRQFVLTGGKRVRPVFCYAGWLAGGARPGDDPIATRAVLRVGAALELLQACALIHDDIIDESDTRRGRRTVHRLLEDEHRRDARLGDSAHHGVSAALLIGDLALAWADDLFSGHPVQVPDRGRAPGDGVAPDAARTVGPVGQVWAAMRLEVLGGQLLDIVTEARGDESLAAATRVMTFKTAAYTVARPLELGATLAGASPGLLTDLAWVGHNMGIAFQLRDDLLGAFGDPALTGKPSGDDLATGKRTALLATGLAFADQENPADAARLRSVIGAVDTDEDLAQARRILVDVGAVRSVEQRIDTLVGEATTTLTRTDMDTGVRDDLIAMCRRIAYRDA